MDDPNPYAPPLAAIDDEPDEKRAWFVAARGIYVKSGVTLPPVDLETGETSTALVPITRKILRVKPGVFILPAIFSVLLFVAYDRETPLRILIAAGIGFMVVQRLLRAFIPALAEDVLKITIHQNPTSVREHRIRRWARGISQNGSVLFIFAFLFVGDPSLKILFIALSFLCSVTLFFFLKPDKRLEFRTSGVGAKRVRIGNAHPSALRRLREIEAVEKSGKGSSA